MIIKIQIKIKNKRNTMGNCQHDSTVLDGRDAHSLPAPEQGIQSRVSNPFYEYNPKNEEGSAGNVLSKYSFHSKYHDQFLGDCSVIQENSTGDLYLCKELHFQSDEHQKDQLAELQAKKNKLVSQNVIRVKEIFQKTTDGFFGEKIKTFIIIDYPFINFQREIADRLSKKISFTKEEVINFFSSTIRGYSSIQRAGYETNKVRLKNIFIGIKSKQPIIKVAESSLIEPKSNFQYLINDGPSEMRSRDIYLSPEEYLAWLDDNEDYKPKNPKSGVYSLGMCFLDVCLMEPSRECYLFTEKKIDQLEIKNRIEIAGKKYSTNIEKFLREMLQTDAERRISFAELEQLLPTLTKNSSQLTAMNLSIIPSQRSNYIHNDGETLRSSRMFKSVVSQENFGGSRVFSSNFKLQKSRAREEEVLQVTQHYTNGNKFKGEKRGNMKHGKGRYELQDGSYFEGEWADNKINGLGTLFFKSGKPEYEGEWRNDLFNGWGTLYSETSNWIKYEGEFKNGVKEGRGRIFFRDGSIYDGEFRGDKISGRGRKITANGEVQEKYWDVVAPQKFI